MTTKKPTPAQLAARKKFAKMAKDGTLAKKRKAASKKKGLKKPQTKGLTTLCAKSIGVNGRKKVNGQLKKKCIIKKGGKVVCSLSKKTIKK